MTFKKCRVCGESVLLYDLDDREEACEDSCFATYDKIVGIKFQAPEATATQRRDLQYNLLAFLKTLGTAREAREKLKNLQLVIGTDGQIRLEDELPTTKPLRVVKPNAKPYVEKSVEDYVGRLSERYGFAEPEDGSEARYEKRRASQSPMRHAFWWWAHNCVAHPLIGLLPRRFAFEFHDWTSRKLHGK